MLSKFPIFIPANVYVYLSTVHRCMLIVLLPADLNNEIRVPVPDCVIFLNNKTYVFKKKIYFDSPDLHLSI